MQDIDEIYCRVVLEASLQAYVELMDATVGESLERIAYGKRDTLGLDGIPESAIVRALRDFDAGALLITEEIGSTPRSNGNHGHCKNYSQIFYLSDPTDRSLQLKQFLTKRNRSQKVGEVLNKQSAVLEWEKAFGTPASTTGATSAITCIRFGVPIATAFTNFISQELFVASRAGVFRMKLPAYSDLEPEQITPEHIRKNGELVLFRSFPQTGAFREKMRHFVTFLGKSGYQENFLDSDLVSAKEMKRYLRYHEPGGPSRPLYLSTVQPVDQPIGFILANGEKIGEWIHWIPLVRFGKTDGENTRQALNLYEIHQERPWTKDGILMSTPPPYSIFSDTEGRGQSFAIDVEKIPSFSNPSRIRSTLLVTHTTNTWALSVMERHRFRKIEFIDPR